MKSVIKLFGMNPVINNSNIKRFVKLYIIGRTDELPRQLQYSPIGKWDVSEVTNMDSLFANTNFNEPLEWDLENVTSMENMFSGCSEFDSPLKFTNMNKVKDMSGMFNPCPKFNQSLKWDVSNVEDMNSMFA